LWRSLKTEIAANRAYPTLAELADRALAWLDAMSNDDHLRCCGLRSSKFDWLPT
jgi:hypothetical protein